MLCGEGGGGGEGQNDGRGGGSEEQELGESEERKEEDCRQGSNEMAGGSEGREQQEVVNEGLLSEGGIKEQSEGYRDVGGARASGKSDQ